MFFLTFSAFNIFTYIQVIYILFKLKLIYMKIFFFLAIASVFLYLASNKYGDHSLNKSILACTIGQKKISPSLTVEEAKLICKREIKKNK